MKKSRKGIVIILLLLVAIPLAADLVISLLVPNRTSMLGMSKQLFMGYLQHLPMLIVYLVIAFTIIFLFRKWKKGQTKNHE